MERWIYRSRKEFSEPYVVIPFYKSESGEYILSGNPLHYAKATLYLSFFDPHLPGEPRADPINKMINMNQMIQARFDIARAIDIASGEKILEESVKALDYYEPLKSELELNFFPSEDNNDYVLLSVDLNLRDLYDGNIAEDAIIPIAMFGKVISLEDNSEYMFSSDDYAPKHIVREGDKASVMASLSLPPGKYGISGGIQEMISGRIFSFHEKIEVPNLENCMQGISNYVLAKGIGAPPSKQPNPLPFSMNVYPKVDNEFHKSEDFAIYYQICSLGVHTETGKQDFDVSYQFYKKDKGDLFILGKPVNFPDRSEAEQGWSFPLSKWPSGEYVVEIEIYDKVKNQKSVSSLEFKVLD